MDSARIRTAGSFARCSDTHRSRAVLGGLFAYQIARELAWNISTLGGTSLDGRETASQALVSVVKMLVAKQRQIQQSRQGIV